MFGNENSCYSNWRSLAFMLTLCIGHGRKTEGKKVRALAQRPDLCLVHEVRTGKTEKLSYNYHRDFKGNATKGGTMQK